MRSNSRQETFVYVVLWAIMFIAPMVSMQFHHVQNGSFPWNELFSIWLQVLNLFFVFLLHNYLLAPLLVYKQKRWLYFSVIAVLTVCFAVLQCVHRPEFKPHGERPAWEERHRPQIDERPHEDALFEHEPPTEHMESDDARHRPMMEKPVDRPPMFFGQHDLISTIICILMLGMNLGVKLYFKQRKDQLRLDKLEKENLQQQLEYLRYQINPHFLMNTLNNIHALVDVDGEKAKETIVELSKIMRYALYEGARQRVPLGRDIAFLEGYVRLMRLRYTDKVDVRLETPEQMPDVEIPPMIFITFVENAFKHGVSYQQQSFICAKFEIQDSTLCFTCKNSKPRTVQPQTAEKEGGVGLQNALQRLQLIYGNHFALNIDETPETYNIRLEIPLY